MSPYRYLLFYKPYGVISQFSPEGDKTTLKDFIDVPDVYPVGRLDWDSEGLMLLTNDGLFQHRLSDPKYAHPRTYLVQVERIPDQMAIDRLAQGVIIQNYHTKPSQTKLLDFVPDLPARNPPIRYRKTVPTAWLEMTLTEGKNRQVRRMTAAVGYPTLRLVRVKMGHINLNGLQLGEWRDLSDRELAQISTWGRS